MKTYKGIDVSKWQGSPDFSKVRDAGYSFVMVKASQGGSRDYPFPFKDPQFDNNMLQLEQTPGELYVGTYHFMIAQTAKQAKKEAEFYISTIRPYADAIQLWAAVDLELDTLNVDRQTYTAAVKTFTDEVRAAGFRPMIYSQYWYLNAYLEALPENVPLWICDINTTTWPEGAQLWQLGQCAVPGIDGACDINAGKAIMGDVNRDGRVNARDVTAMMRYIVTGSPNIDLKQADFDRDGKITARDVTALMKAVK